MKKEKTAQIIGIILITALLMQETAFASDEDPTGKEPLAEVLGGEAVKLIAKLWIVGNAWDFFGFLTGITYHLGIM